MDRIDWDEPFEEVIGVSFIKYRYSQNGMYFNIRGIRVHADGAFWTLRDQVKVDEVNDLQEASKEDTSLAGAAKAAKKGIDLPKRILTRGKK